LIDQLYNLPEIVLLNIVYYLIEILPIFSSNTHLIKIKNNVKQHYKAELFNSTQSIRSLQYKCWL